jgi:hypothetical protein
LVQNKKKPFVELVRRAIQQPQPAHSSQVERGDYRYGDAHAHPARKQH